MLHEGSSPLSLRFIRIDYVFTVYNIRTHKFWYPLIGLGMICTTFVRDPPLPALVCARFGSFLACLVSGLIITEATQVSRDGQGYPYTPGVFTPEQIAGWKNITDAVHAKVCGLHLIRNEACVLYRVSS